MNQLYSLFFKKNSNIENIDEAINDSIKVKETTDVLKLQEIIIDTESSNKDNDSQTVSKNKSFFSKIPRFSLSKKNKSIPSNLNHLSKQDEIVNNYNLSGSIHTDLPNIHPVIKRHLSDLNSIHKKTDDFKKENNFVKIIPDLFENNGSSTHSKKNDIILLNDSIKTNKLPIETSYKIKPSMIYNDVLSGCPVTNVQKYKPFHFHEEIQYLNLIREIINTGSYEKTRNGNTYTKFGYNMRFNLKNGVIPILTTKKMAWKTCFEELFWFIRGSTSNIELNEKNIHIWDDNCKRDFLDKRGLYYYKEGDLGPIYGHQWRHFNAEYKSCDTCYQGEGIDQLQHIIDQLKDPETRTSRRLIMSAWNPCQISSMALPPCHIVVQFHVRENKYLSCALFQRSGDVGLGIPFNIASYSLLTHILAKHCDLEADEFVHFIGNCHIYEEHIDALKEQIKRDPLLFPRIEIKNKFENIEDYSLDDIEWTTKYNFHESIKMTMIA
jgi:thymidylate synthase